MNRSRPWDSDISSVNANNQSFHGTNRWKKASKRQRDNDPYCTMCLLFGKETILNTHGEHIIPIQYGGAELAKANLQTLCDSCHIEKTKLENQVNGAIYDSYADYALHGSRLPIINSTLKRPISAIKRNLIDLCGNMGAGKTAIMAYLPSNWDLIELDQIRIDVRDEEWAWELVTEQIENTAASTIVFESSGVNRRLFGIYRRFLGNIIRIKLECNDTTALKRIKARPKRVWTATKGSSEDIYNFLKPRIDQKPVDKVIQSDQRSEMVAKELIEWVGGL